ncbi:MAG TPA: hypothetical protein VN372_10960 [Methanospirillum sp.]|nr:hypothetical protein [Methanospirillum sp.]
MKYLLVIGILLVCCISMPSLGESPVNNSQSVSDTTKGYFPTYPLDPNVQWRFNLELEGGYPMVPHAFGPFTEEDWIKTDEDKTQTISVILYNNSPLFPNKTVYGVTHDQLRFAVWLMEMKNPVTGDDMLAQVAETAKDTYDMNKTPAENDYLGNIGWFVVNGKLYPRTWISGHMKAGQSWIEYWGPYSPDVNGSLVRERRMEVREEPVILDGKTYDGYIIRMTGPIDIGQNMESTEEFTIVDGLGAVHRIISINSTEPIPANSLNPGQPAQPAGTMVLRHVASFVSMTDRSNITAKA